MSTAPTGILVFILAPIAFTTGCARPAKIDVAISSFRNSDTPTEAVHDGGRVYLMLPAKDGITSDNLEFREYAVYVERVLADKAFTRTTDPTQASVVVGLFYDVDSSRHTSFQNIPIVGQTGGGYTSFNANSFGPSGSSYTSGSVYQQPTYGVVGSRTKARTIVLFHRLISIGAFDIKSQGETNKLVPIWETRIVSSGRNGDMRQVFPALLAASADRIGTNTGKQIRLTIRENDARIAWVKGQSLKPKRTR